MMKNKLIALAAMMALTVMSASSYAQSANSGSNSGSESNAGAVAGSTANNAGIGNSRSTSASGSESNSGAVAGSQSNTNVGVGTSVGTSSNQNVIFVSPDKQRVETHISGTQTIKNVPSVTGPNLTTSNDTCMGSTSGSINGPGFGIGLGSTWTDDNCVMLKNSRELWNMGMKAASMALMCTDARTRGALQVTGYECPNTLDGRPIATPRSYSAAPGAPVVAESPQYTDPYVRARLGLPPLTAAK